LRGFGAVGPDGARTGSKLSSELGSGEPSDDPPSTVAEQVAARLIGDEADLYLAFNPRLVRIVQRSVDAPHEVGDDACAFAWVQFMRVQPDRERNWRSWLITTAEREAWRLRREEAKTFSFEFETVDDLERDPVDPRDHVDERARLRHALELLSAVPERRRRIKALHVIGYKYEEIGELLGSDRWVGQRIDEPRSKGKAAPEDGFS